jgi:hypothetical protein
MVNKKGENKKMDIVFLVKGFISSSAKEKSVFYNGRSALKAFEYLEKYIKQAGVVVEIWEDGCLVKSFEK